MLMLKMMIIITWNLFISSNQSMLKIYILTLNMLIMMLIMSIYLKMSWFPIIFSLLMISGLLTLFMYMSSINTSFKTTSHFFTPNKIIMMVILIAMKIFYTSPYMMQPMPLKTYNHLNIFNNMNSMYWTLMMILLLFIIMIINLEIISNFNSSIRSNYS